DVVGGRQRGYKTADTPAPADSPDSATTDPRGQLSSGGGTQAPPPGRPQDSPIASAPSLADVRRAGMFARPALTEAAIANDQPLSRESLVATVRAAADRAQVGIGGRVTLDPNWRCWSSTPTAISR